MMAVTLLGKIVVAMDTHVPKEPDLAPCRSAFVGCTGSPGSSGLALLVAERVPYKALQGLPCVKPSTVIFQIGFHLACDRATKPLLLLFGV